ncbi:MAG: Ig-like domain-containing protein, partial [Isosphaeraceae bacterium]
VPHDDFSRGIERVPNHNSTHGYIGGNGDMSFPARSTRDPFFFLLHGKVDELWARWQRANPSRFDSATAYGSAAGNPVLTSPQHPWDGVPNAGPPIDPWTAGGGYIVSKTSFDRSVVSPPIYDTAPLTIPALAPGQAVILEIPWYPPNPAHYACLGDMRHFCLLARITPGITTPEVSDVSANVRNNNNIAWKNIEVVDDFPGAMAAFSFFVRNDTERPMAARLLFREATDRFVTLSDQVAAVHVGLPPDLQRRWEEGGSRQQGLKPAELNLEPLRNVNPEIAKSRLLTLGGGAGMLDNLRLRPGEGYPVHLVFQLKPDYVPSRDVMVFDVVQRQVVGERTEIVGGVQYRLDLSRIELVKERGHWRFPADDTAPPEGWYGLNFDDSKWREGPAPFGFGRDQELTAGVPLGAEKGRTAYFRKRFQVGDRAFLRDLTLRARYDDGIVVYLNGREVHRANLPSGALTPTTPALKPVSGAAEKAFFTTKLKPDMLREGANVLAVEVRQHEPRGGDLVFDAELSANRADSAEAPSVSFLSVGQGALVKTGQELTVNLDAIAPDGHVRDVTLFANDRQVGALDRPPYDFKWMPSDGPQRLRAIAVDGEGRMSAEEVTVVGLKNVPPTVRMSVRQGDRARTLILSAEANDQDGKIREVEFFMAENDRFDAPWVSVGKKSEPPYEVTMPEPETHHRMVSVQATDDGGEVGVASTHIHGQGHR